MSEIANLVDALKRIQNGDAWHGPALKEILGDVNAEQASASPIAGAHSIWALVLHIAAWEEAFCKRLDGNRIDEPPDGDFPAVGETEKEDWIATLARMDAAHKRLLEVISALSESALEQTVVGKEYSVAFMLHGIIRHHVYHAGQIGLLKKLGAGLQT